jgi:LAO/AO transport system kinase
VSPGGGDELQGVKRGIMELADLVVVTKADGDLLPAARRAEADYRHAAHFIRRRFEAWEPTVLAVSSVDGTGVGEVWGAVTAHRSAIDADGTLASLRAEQAVLAFWREVERGLVQQLRAGAAAEDLGDLERSVAARETSPSGAAWRALGFRG